METRMKKKWPVLNALGTSAPGATGSVGQDATRHSQQPRYSHELPEESTDALSRLIVRVVPLIFGTLLGSLAGNLAIGIIAASAIALAFDLSMEDQSLVRGVLRRLRRQAS